MPLPGSWRSGSGQTLRNIQGPCPPLVPTSWHLDTSRPALAMPGARHPRHPRALAWSSMPLPGSWRSARAKPLETCPRAMPTPGTWTPRAQPLPCLGRGIRGIRGHWPGAPCPCQALGDLARAKPLETWAMPTPSSNFLALGHLAPSPCHAWGAASAASDGIGLDLARAKPLETCPHP